MEKMLTVDDYKQRAMELLPPLARDYYRSGAGDELSLQWNQMAFQKLRIRPKVLRNVSHRDLSTMVMGEKVSMPLGVSPTAMQRMAHPDGECANARAAQAAGTIFTLSTISTSSIEEVAAAAPKAVKWFQLYILRDRNLTLELIRRAEKSDYRALVVTVDAPIFGTRRSDVRNKFSLPGHLKLANFIGPLSNKIHSAENGSGLQAYVTDSFDDSLSWDDISWLKTVTKLPVIVKGILTAEDALLSIKYGANGIVVSNHGARQIDGTAATIEVLPEIVRAVGNKVEIYLDGGVTQGTDVLKALALGAKMVFIGRPMIWGLACGGEKGAKDILEIFRSEIDQTFALTGCRTVSEVTRDLVVHESFYSRL
ncbi:hydroxyacid oxidase 1 isoform X2 [Venturia canescens]|uniref:hydroxyacid oxidase 1 isoform X2 n=1 Tax=Venturia canescens TaxID=32260 RepID=UPI001C9C8078|nr:hydroxyacid oxidase 1 isoform X2 [Venturia canescens]